MWDVALNKAAELAARLRGIVEDPNTHPQVAHRQQRTQLGSTLAVK